MRKKVLSVLLCATLVAGIAVGCGSKSSSEKSSADAKKSDKKVITVGCEATTPGWIQTDEKGKLSGYDYDVWQEIGKRIGYEIDYKVMEWDSLWVMLADNRLDSVGEQISYNSEREEKYNLSEPYAYNLYSLLCAKDNEALQSMNDLKSGMTISCETNTSDELIVNAINEQYNTNVVESNVYPFAKTDRGEKLCKLTSDAIKEMKEDGTLKELSEKWFDTDVTVKPEGSKDLK